LLARAFHLPVALTYIILLGTLALAGLAAGMVVRRVLRRWLRIVHGGWERLTLETLESLAIPLLIVMTMDVAIAVLDIPPGYVRLVHILVFGLSLGIAFYFLDKLAELLLRNLFKDDDAFDRVTQPATLFVRFALGSLALVIFLENVGVSLTAVWTTLGVGSVAIGLALQATLSNFFAGVTLLADRPVSPGDHILLGPGPAGPNLEGEVLRIGWRATEVQIPSKEISFIPNSVMASTILTNYSVSGAGTVVSVPVKLQASADIDKAEALLIETAKGVTERLQAQSAIPPHVALTSEFTDPFIQLTLRVSVARFADRDNVSHALRKEILTLYRRGDLKLP